MRASWEEYYMNIAQQVANRSNCIRRQIGAIIVLENRIITTGYNGTPRGVRNCDEGGCPRCQNTTAATSGTNLSECCCSHAEENAIVQGAYHGTAVKGGTLYTTLSPCLTCAKLIINSGIRKVIYQDEYPAAVAKGLLVEASVEVVLSKKRDKAHD